MRGGSIAIGRERHFVGGCSFCFSVTLDFVRSDLIQHLSGQ
jgi:hypothetical protein